MLCDALGVSKSRYYEWRQRPISKQQKRIQALDYMITEIFNEHKSRYGSTRIYYEGTVANLLSLIVYDIVCLKKGISNLCLHNMSW